MYHHRGTCFSKTRQTDITDFLMLVKEKTKCLLLRDSANACLSRSTLFASNQISQAEPGEAVKTVALASTS